VGDRAEADDVAGGGERLDVPDAGRVHLAAVEAVGDGAVGRDLHPVRGEQLDLASGRGVALAAAVGVQRQGRVLPAIRFTQAQTALCCMAVVGLTGTAA
jgi:hypothetical protein